jgi:hypothetical protein
LIDVVLDTQQDLMETSWHATCIASWRILTSQWIQFILSQNSSSSLSSSFLLGGKDARVETLFISDNRTLQWVKLFINQSRQNNIIHDNKSTFLAPQQKQLQLMYHTKAAQYSGRVVIGENVSCLLSYFLSKVLVDVELSVQAKVIPYIHIYVYMYLVYLCVIK